MVAVTGEGVEQLPYGMPDVKHVAVKTVSDRAP